jgi:hypothetical protein
MELAAWFDVVPNTENRKMKVEQVGGLRKARKWAARVEPCTKPPL